MVNLLFGKNLPPKGGRPEKDACLRARDMYVARYLRERQPRRSYAALEVELHRGLRPVLGERKNGGGPTQPHAWSKRAAGTRGISDSLGDVPKTIKIAESLYPGVRERYESALWAALWLRGPNSTLRRLTWKLPTSLKVLLCRGDNVDADDPILTVAEMQRVARLAHVDGLGQLLLQTYWHPPRAAHYALRLANQVFWQLVACDPAFASLHNQIAELVFERFHYEFRSEPPTPPSPSAGVAGQHPAPEKAAQTPVAKGPAVRRVARRGPAGDARHLQARRGGRTFGYAFGQSPREGTWSDLGQASRRHDNGNRQRIADQRINWRLRRQGSAPGHGGARLAG